MEASWGGLGCITGHIRRISAPTVSCTEVVQCPTACQIVAFLVDATPERVRTELPEACRRQSVSNVQVCEVSICAASTVFGKIAAALVMHTATF